MRRVGFVEVDADLVVIVALVESVVVAAVVVAVIWLERILLGL